MNRLPVCIVLSRSQFPECSIGQLHAVILHAVRLNSSQSSSSQTSAYGQLREQFATKTTYRASQKLIRGNEQASESSQNLGCNQSLKPAGSTRSQHQVFPLSSSHNSSILHLNDIIQQNFSPIQTLAVFRHGSRYPSREHVDNAYSMLDRLQCRGVAVDKLRNVLDQFRPCDASQLSRTGEDEMFELGRRTKCLVADGGDQVCSDRLLFGTTRVKRTIDSCRWFRKGLFSTGSVAESLRRTRISNEELEAECDNRSESTVRDDLLRTFELDPRYVLDVTLSASASCKEYLDFRECILDRVVSDVKDRLKVKQFHMNSEEMMSLYNVAGCEVAVLGSGHWSHLLSPNSHDLLEYATDLKHYWKFGHGRPINYLHSLPLVSDWLEHLKQAVDSEHLYKKAILYFGHAESLIPFVSLLGLFRETLHLTADNCSSQHDRLFRTSYVAPFSSNISMTLYRCHDITKLYADANPTLRSVCLPVKPNPFMVVLKYNETPIQFAFSSTLLSSYDDVMCHLRCIVESCSVDHASEKNFL